MNIEKQSSTVTTAYIQTPFKLTYRQVELRNPGIGEVMLDVSACGICGYDMQIAGYLAPEPTAFGHEIVGIVREVGQNVKGVVPGDQVILESGSFCCDCDNCRNGRVDLCNKGANIWGEPAMGFSDALIAPMRAVVPAPDINPLSAVIAEPCGVSLDITKVAEIGITDSVLVVGTGPIGLMAVAIARKLTAGTLAAADISNARLESAKKMGADFVVNTKETSLEDFSKQFNKFDKILVTAPPTVIPDCIKAAAFGAYIVFLGSDFDGGGVVPIDTHAVHFGKMQLRASFASPALYMPQVLELLRKNVVPASEVVSHCFPLSKLDEAMRTLREQPDTTRKVAIIPDKRFDEITGGKSK